MRVLVVAGCCLYVNSSANLCHRAYIQGLVDLGHSVDLLCFSKNMAEIDNNIKLPDIKHIHEYNGISLYEKISKISRGSSDDVSLNFFTNKAEVKGKKSIKEKVFTVVKSLFWKSYGIYNPSISWYRKAKHFKSSAEYDLVISLAYPPVSHLVAKRLIKTSRVKTKRWIEIWEDPWTFELYNAGEHHEAKYFKKCYKAEKELLDACNEILYVSPLTLKIQKEKFPEYANNMKWLPLPTYFMPELVEYKHFENHYGYFGDYPPTVRNLEPLYNVAVKNNLHLDICGSPYGLFTSKGNVVVNPRLPLKELKSHEANVNVLICLFNLKGGQIPGKIYQYAATNKIIIAILDGLEEEKRIIKEYFSKFNRFFFCENNEESIFKMINMLENCDYKDIISEPLDSFSPKEIVKQIIGNGVI